MGLGSTRRLARTPEMGSTGHLARTLQLGSTVVPARTHRLGSTVGMARTTFVGSTRGLALSRLRLDLLCLSLPLEFRNHRVDATLQFFGHLN